MRWLCELIGHNWRCKLIDHTRQQFSTEWCDVPYFRCTRCDCVDHACNHAFRKAARAAIAAGAVQQEGAYRAMREAVLDWTPTGAMGLPAWQYDLRMWSAALRFTDKPLTPEFRVSLADGLARFHAAIQALAQSDLTPGSGEGA